MPYPHFVIARLHEHIEPMDRGERYEDPLIAVLEDRRIGTVTGGGSQLSESGEIEFADIEIELADLGPSLDIAVEALERAGAPAGSRILEGPRVLREFGRYESLAVYLDGISLPDDVYAGLDFDQVVKDLGAAAGPDSYHGFSQGAEESGLFFFGPSAEEMLARVQPVLAGMPIGQNARVVVRPGRDATRHRTVRMPRRPASG